MYCAHCGNEIDNNAVVCIHCGVPTKKLQQNFNNGGGQLKVTNGLGTAGFVVGLLSLWLGVIFAIPAIIGLVFSILGVVNAKNCNSANGLAVAGLVISIISSCSWILFWMFAFGMNIF